MHDRRHLSTHIRLAADRPQPEIAALVRRKHQCARILRQRSPGPTVELQDPQRCQMQMAHLAVFAVFAANYQPSTILYPQKSSVRRLREQPGVGCSAAVFVTKSNNRGNPAAGAVDFSRSLGKMSRMSERVAPATFFVNIIITSLF